MHRVGKRLCEHGIGLQLFKLRPGETDVYLQRSSLCKFACQRETRGAAMLEARHRTYRLSGHAR